MLNGGKTMLITTGKKGKYVGVDRRSSQGGQAAHGFISSRSTGDSTAPRRP